MSAKRALIISLCFGAFSALVPAATQAAVTAASSMESTSAGWPGFSQGFNPYWSGETKRINWRRPGGIEVHRIILTGGGCFGCGFPDFDLSPPKPIELISSSRSIAASAEANIYVAGEHANAEHGDYASTTSDGFWNTTQAYYADVIDLDDLSLGRASALASLTSNIESQSFELTARQLAITKVDPLVYSPSLVSASSNIDFSASYQVYEPAHFRLAGTFSGAVDLDVLLTLTDRNSGEVYYEQSLTWFDHRGEEIDFRFEGEFSPGIYDIDFSSNANSAIRPTGTVDPSGIGEFSIGFEAFSLTAGDFDKSGVVGTEDLNIWEASFGQHGNNGDLDNDGSTDTNDAYAWLELNAGNDVNDDGSVDVFDFTAWLQEATPGDADHDNDIDGHDFLAWQRTKGNTGQPANFLQQIPEPNAVVLLFFGAITCLHNRATSRGGFALASASSWR